MPPVYRLFPILAIRYAKTFCTRVDRYNDVLSWKRPNALLHANETIVKGRAPGKRVPLDGLEAAMAWMDTPYRREHPSFSLCGLNCALCPRHRTEGGSRCPGCGGSDFNDLHPSCAIITCARKHGNPAFCHECGAYPCERYQKPFPADSFITYQHVQTDLSAAREDLPGYLAQLEQRRLILERLLKEADDGRSKSFYCLAATLLSVQALERVIGRIDEGVPENRKERAVRMRTALLEAGKTEGVSLVLRKK